MDNHQTNNVQVGSPVGRSTVDDKPITAPEESHVHPNISTIKLRTSLIVNTRAQACTLVRARGAVLLVAHKTKPGVKHTYKQRTPGTTLKSAFSQSYSPLSPSQPSCVSLSSLSDSSSDDVLCDGQDSILEPVQSPCAEMCPYTFIESTLLGEQHPLQPLLASEFLTPTAEQIAAYDHDVLAAVRTSDIGALRAMHSQGRTLRCCNRFGESLPHVACRRSTAAVVSFLLHEAEVSPRIKDDYGRTPLHDACWRGDPAFDIVELLLGVEPRLAFVPDVRGHKPFQYARREHWGAWTEFLDRKRELLL